MALAARDKKTLLALIEQAQVVYLLSRYPRKQVLDDRRDGARLEEGLEGMRAAARDVPARIKDAHTLIPWDELAKRPDTAQLAWRRAKRIAPTIIRELAPLLAGEPEAGFLLRPEAPKGRKAKTKAASRRAAKRR